MTRKDADSLTESPPGMAHPAPRRDADRIVAELRSRADTLGFDAFGIASAEERPEWAAHLDEALARGWHGDMEWMSQTADRRRSPQALWPEARSIIMLGINYGPHSDPMDLLGERTRGNISAYARNRDYHDVIKGRLKELAGLLARRTGAEVKVFVDTAPVMEKPLAEAAGIGWQGKHTVLVSRRHGSWMFLGAIFTSVELPPSDPHPESCGTCRRCLDVCPTDAFPGPFQLDARRCLAYLNIEAKEQIPREYRAPMGNRIYGCDDCLAVCPWNKFASETHEAKLQARADLEAPDLCDLVELDEAGFRKLFAGSPVKRLGHTRFIRNVLVAIGNSGDISLLPRVEGRLSDPEPLIRGVAVWAFRRLAPAARVAAAYETLIDDERDPGVASEWSGPVTPALDPQPGTTS